VIGTKEVVTRFIIPQGFLDIDEIGFLHRQSVTSTLAEINISMKDTSNNEVPLIGSKHFKNYSTTFSQGSITSGIVGTFTPGQYATVIVDVVGQSGISNDFGGF